MPKTIPVALQAHYDTGVTTTCQLVRVQLRDDTVFGMTSLDRDVTYDDGNGSVLYRAKTGAMLSALDSASDLSVGNADGQTLFSLADSPLSPEEVRSGALDFAEIEIYQVNYAGLSDGHEHLFSGVTGRVKTDIQGLSYVQEFRAWSSLLKQTESCKRGSNRCRAVFGDTECGIDTAPLWVEGEVTSVDGDEPDRVFADSAFVPLDPAPTPGLLEWLTGNNAGRYVEIELYSAGEFSLMFPVPYDVEVGDTFRARADCQKRFVEDCIGVWDNGLNFRGEPYRNVSDSGAVNVPGARTDLLYDANPVSTTE